MWQVISLLPADIFVRHVLTNLDFYDFPHLDQAWPKAHREDLYQSCFELLPALDIPKDHQRIEKVVNWFWKRHFRVKLLSLRCLHEGEHTLRQNIDRLDGIDLLIKSSKEIGRSASAIVNHSVFRDKIRHLQVQNRVCYALDPSIWTGMNMLTSLQTLTVPVRNAHAQTAVEQVLSNNLQLRSLTLVYQNIPSQFADLFRYPVARHLTKLHIMIQNFCGNDCSWDLSVIGQYCSELKDLHLRVSNVNSILREGLTAIAQGCTQLRTVELDNCDTVGYPSSVTCSFIRHCTHTTELKCTTDVDDTVLQTAALYGHNLTTLKEGVWTVTSSAVVHSAAAFLRNLKELHLLCNQNTETGWECLILAAQYLGALEVLNLYLANESYTSSHALLEALSKHCHSLHKLTLSGLSGKSYNDHEYDKHLLALVKGNSATLRELYLRGEGGSDLKQLCKALTFLPNLRKLTYYVGYGGYTDEDICCIAKHCPRLTNLEPIGGNKSLTDRAIMALADHCPQLSELNLGNCTQFSETALVYLVQHCRGAFHLIVPRVPWEAQWRIEDAGRAVRKCLKEKLIVNDSIG